MRRYFVSLIGIEENSVHLKFKPKVFGVVLSAAIIINSAIVSNQYQTLPFKSVESLIGFGHSLSVGTVVEKFQAVKNYQ